MHLPDSFDSLFCQDGFVSLLRKEPDLHCVYFSQNLEAD